MAAKQHNMNITSPAFGHNQLMPARYTCDGEEQSPPLCFNNIPAEAKSLVLIVEDPDVPKTIRADGLWDHWIVFNIPPAVTEISAGEEPPGLHGSGTSGSTAYQGPCPPDREHRYFFKLYALDIMLKLSPGASKKAVEHAMQNHIIARAELIGRYQRQS